MEGWLYYKQFLESLPDIDKKEIEEIWNRVYGNWHKKERKIIKKKKKEKNTNKKVNIEKIIEEDKLIKKKSKATEKEYLNIIYKDKYKRKYRSKDHVGIFNKFRWDVKECQKCWWTK